MSRFQRVFWGDSQEALTGWGSEWTRDSGRGLRRALAGQMSGALGIYRTVGPPRTMKPWGGGPSAARTVGSRCCRSRAPNCTPRRDPDLHATKRRCLCCILRPSNWNDAVHISRPSPPTPTPAGGRRDVLSANRWSVTPSHTKPPKHPQ